MTELQVEVETNSSSREPIPKPQVMYRCKKCRRIVAIEENIVPHEPGKGEECFAWKKRSGNSEQVQCSSIFVEPMKWMQTIHDGCVEEKLLCLGCSARLGYFNWAGMQCSCGAWVNPAFQLHKSRLDECKTEPNPSKIELKTSKTEPNPSKIELKTSKTELNPSKTEPNPSPEIV